MAIYSHIYYNCVLEEEALEKIIVNCSIVPDLP